MDPFQGKKFPKFYFSRNHLNNKSVKYKDNIEIVDNLLQDYVSEEIENKFRFENTIRDNGWKINFGTGVEYVTFKNNTFQKIIYQNISDTLQFESKLNFVKTSLFGQISKKALDNKLIASFGIRTDQKFLLKGNEQSIKTIISY